jgi:FtsZ-interacting cell division protein YlmF
MVRRVGFLDNMKSHFKNGNDDEAEFERAFRDGSWPEGVEDFAPLENTGSFLPTTYDVDPLADESLPGNALRSGEQKDPAATESVVRGSTGGAPKLTVVEGGAGRAAQQKAATPAASMPEDGVQVVSRASAGAGSSQARRAAEQRPFADRLRDRVEAAGADGSFDPVAAMPARHAHGSENVSSEELDAEFEERRRARRASNEARAAASREQVERETAHMVEGHADEAAPSSTPAPTIGVSCVVVRPRSYEDVSTIAQAAVAEHRPAILLLRGCSGDLMQRILDFSFGLCCASHAELRDLGNKVYGVFPRGTALTSDDVVSLRRQGIAVRG